MITQYHRPKSIDEAIHLLSTPSARPMAGGTVLNLPSEEAYIAVDLQSLGLEKIHRIGDKLEIGATVTLQNLVESSHLPQAIIKALKHEAPLNLRNMGTMAGSFVACDGRSPFLTAMLALDPKIYILPTEKWIPLGDFLPLRTEILQQKLITKISLSINLILSYEYVARTPADKPILCIAMARWHSGRTRMVLGGWGKIPSLALDGKFGLEDDVSVLAMAAQNTASNASDEWASSEYRCAVAPVLAKRCMEEIRAQCIKRSQVSQDK